MARYPKDPNQPPEENRRIYEGPSEDESPTGEEDVRALEAELRAGIKPGPSLEDVRRPPTQPVVIDGVTRVALENAPPPVIQDDPAAALNAVILSCTTGLRFRNYSRYIDRVFCRRHSKGGFDETREELQTEKDLRQAAIDPDQLDGPTDFRAFSNLYAYDLLKVATEAYIAMECAGYPDDADDLLGYKGTVLSRENSRRELIDTLNNTYLVGGKILPYIDTVIDSYIDIREASTDRVSLCRVSPIERFQPCCIELIWNYWHEEGMLVQAINAISLRFQNKRAGSGRDPLANLEIEPLRPISNLFWGYIQDEANRLTIVRRAYEYAHEYGLSLFGKAVPAINPADVRSKFLEAFHNLLHIASVYYKDQANRFVVPDAFPLLNAIKEVHLILAEGAHNQSFDLTRTARVEMLIQKWLLSRPELERFLGGRFMVPYPEKWMGIVDTMKTLQGWTDVSVRHFRDLGVYGEQLLLSIRYGNWSDVTSTLSAENWATIWKDPIQQYVHSYRAATGVDLSMSTNAIRLAAESYTQPSVLLNNRLSAQRRP
jgi:hypothetical protein